MLTSSQFEQVGTPATRSCVLLSTLASFLEHLPYVLGQKDASGSSHTLPAPSPRIGHFFKEPYFHLVEKDISSTKRKRNNIFRDHLFFFFFSSSGILIFSQYLNFPYSFIKLILHLGCGEDREMRPGTALVAEIDQLRGNYSSAITPELQRVSVCKVLPWDHREGG